MSNQNAIGRTHPGHGNCPRCAGGLHWEARETADAEHWLGVCRHCGYLTGFSVEDDVAKLDEPLSRYLGELRQRAVSPPWVRLFRVSERWPWNIAWRFHGGCTRCEAQLTFAASVPTRARLNMTLCLHCGETTVSYRRRADGHTYAELTGNGWSPAEPAVRKLRQAVFNRGHYEWTIV